MFASKVLKKDFGVPEKLTDIWIDEHKDHNPVWSIHTVFEGTQGIKYRECKCYGCCKVAQIKLEDVQTEAQRTPPRQSDVLSRRKPNKEFSCEKHDSDEFIQSDKVLETLKGV